MGALAFTDRLQAMIERQEAILADGGSGPKHARECEAVLNALRRLEALLAEAPVEKDGRDIEDDEVASDTSTPDVDLTVSSEAFQALELQHRQHQHLCQLLYVLQPRRRIPCCHSLCSCTCWWTIVAA